MWAHTTRQWANSGFQFFTSRLSPVMKGSYKSKCLPNIAAAGLFSFGTLWYANSAGPVTPPTNKPLFFFQHQVCMIPHPEKRAKGGEDAYFVSSDSRALGVADGVGGWAKEGVDPAIYARKLMLGAKQSYDETGKPDPLFMMTSGHNAAKGIRGSSTCCIVVLDQETPSSNPILRTANLGDSGFLIIRSGQIVFRSRVQQHQFNFPYQLGGGLGGDLPSSANLLNIHAKEGDLVVLGTDGLFDNLFDHEILQVVNESLRNHKVDQLAQLIGVEASKKAGNPFVTVPFGKEAQMAGYGLVVGGKLDDITVLVGQICSSEAPSSHSPSTNPSSAV